MVVAAVAIVIAAEPVAPGAAQPAGGAKTAAAVKPQPKVEVAFVLDTTGSMSGLIEGAKAKIWYIANQIVLGEPKPIVRMGLVAYRDKGDEYVTRVYDLTDNIDQVYTDLMKFQTGGGGDTPEHVNKALDDAVHKLSWSADKKTLKIIYLVGDSPPHNEYKDTPTYDKLTQQAIEKGIYVNTILCGGNTETAGIWKEIAKGAEGTFLAIAQDGGVVEIATPFDADMAKLNRDLVGTAVVYGSAREQAAQKALNTGAASYAAPAAAERGKFALNSGKVADRDLVKDAKEGKVDVAKLKQEELPADMQKMSPEEQKKHLADMSAKREKVTTELKELSAKRDEYIKQELAKNKDAKKGFDSQVLEVLKSQAARRDITYK